MMYQRINTHHIKSRGWGAWPVRHQQRQQQARRRAASSAPAPASSKYDHPALYTNDDAFAERTYWDGRFRGEALGKEWYRGYASLRPVLRAHLNDPARSVLHAGVGTSTLQVDMALDGYASVLSVDYSSVAIERLEAAREAYAGPQAARLRAALTYEVADMRDLGRHADGAFGGGAIEKGALDALACGDTADADLKAAVRELWRVLARGAALVSVTWAKPAARLPVLLGAAAWASACVYEVGQAGAVAGPFSVNDVGRYSSSSRGGGIADGDPLASLPTLAYSHFAYVCVK